ncbi:hypothetical protein [Sporomusa acidovorans]|uniref:Uncharacterized protein n=1 Tax=Sporomusa acidovorans (strain ATCC 49682 / DSM 3132 / Mol) TaxID=1123286 RepID=A0ABZ3J961_SPOA4|nr:hypothetical protein [Sporomusa acidovorans]OZC16018.1 hypothetical protein SPACI_43840 [Sporomusa acidovorans DSM 3132]SDD89529.1 hypothetical protein SAMN04488499_1005113 [Sporomusa acidovorans]
MDLHVKRFKVRYQGKDYGPGSVIYNVEQELAKKLAAGSNGTIEALPEREETTTDETDIKNEVSKVANDEAVSLPSVDPKKTMK